MAAKRRQQRKLTRTTTVKAYRPFQRGAVPEGFHPRDLTEDLPIHYTIEFNEADLREMLREAAHNKSQRRVSGPATAYVSRDRQPEPVTAEQVVCRWCGLPPSAHTRIDPSDDGLGSRSIHWRCPE